MPADTRSEHAAFAVVERFKQAFDASDPAAIVELFAPGAVLLGTRMERPTADGAAILEYFRAARSSNLPKTITIEDYETLRLSDGAVLFTGRCRFSQTVDGKRMEAPARFTFVVTKTIQGWAVAHFHSSMIQGPP